MNEELKELLEQLLQESKQTNLLLTEYLQTNTLPTITTPTTEQLAIITGHNPSGDTPAAQVSAAPPPVIKPFKELAREVPDVHDIKNRVRKIGINDAPYRVSYKENGETFTCPYYEKWKGLLRNNFTQWVDFNSTGGVPLNKLYRGCKVKPEWIYFKHFLAWYIQVEQATGVTPHPRIKVQEDVVSVDDILGSTEKVVTEITSNQFTCFSDNFDNLTTPKAFTSPSGAPCNPKDSVLYLEASSKLLMSDEDLTPEEYTLLLQYHSALLEDSGELDYYSKLLANCECDF